MVAGGSAKASIIFENIETIMGEIQSSIQSQAAPATAQAIPMGNLTVNEKIQTESNTFTVRATPTPVEGVFYHPFSDGCGSDRSFVKRAPSISGATILPAR